MKIGLLWSRLPGVKKCNLLQLGTLKFKQHVLGGKAASLQTTFVLEDNFKYKNSYKNIVMIILLKLSIIIFSNLIT